MARILVVDDAAFMRKMVSDALTKGGHEVVGEAGNGAEAVVRFQELKPELTTLDILKRRHSDQVDFTIVGELTIEGSQPRQPSRSRWPRRPGRGTFEVMPRTPRRREKTRARTSPSATSAPSGPTRVAVIGGGIAALTTAFELTRPELNGQYEVTVYQMGWRLGGKGASSRGVPDTLAGTTSLKLAPVCAGHGHAIVAA